MSVTVLLAAGAGACGVLALWHGLWAAEAAPDALRAIGLVTKPWRDAGETGGEATAAERRRFGALAATCAGTGAWLVGGAGLALTVALLAPAITVRLLAARRERWRRRVGADLPQVARAIADALAGGHSVRGALIEVARTGGAGPAASPTLMGLRRALEVGESTAAALEAWRDHVRRPGADLLVAAILMQQQAGGALAGLLRDIASDLEAAQRADADAAATTAQSRFTALLVGALPAGAMGLVELAQPGAVGGLLGAPLPRALALAALVLAAVAVLVVHRCARVAA